MLQEVQVGSILIRECLQLLGLENEPYSGHWSILKALDGVAVDRKIRAAGWNFFFITSQVKVTFFGAPGPQKIKRALGRILAKVSSQHFNGLEVTGIVTKHFLGLPYATVLAHSRHVQQSCYLESAGVRRLSQRDAARARD